MSPKRAAPHGFAFALVVGAIAILGRVWSRSPGMSIPLPLSVFLGAGVHLVLGGWFFSTRASSSDGLPLGWRRAMEIVALTLGLLLATVLVLLVLVRALSSVVHRQF